MKQTQARYITENYNGLVIERDKAQSVPDMVLMHTHNQHELYFLLSGTRRYLIGHTLHTVYAGDLVVIPRNMLHRTTKFQSPGYDRYVVYFPDSYADVLRKEFGSEAIDQFLAGGCIQFPPAQIEKLRLLFSDLEQELSRQDKISHLISSGKLYEIIITALRYGSPRLREPEKTIRHVEQVAAYVTNHYADSITLHQAAQMAYLEDSYFSRQFKKYTGFGFVEYLTQIRVSKAAELLSTTERSVSNIAEACGFSGSNYFGDVFRKYYGVSPLEYRRRFQRYYKQYMQPV